MWRIQAAGPSWSAQLQRWRCMGRETLLQMCLRIQELKGNVSARNCEVARLYVANCSPVFRQYPNFPCRRGQSNRSTCPGPFRACPMR